MVSETFPNSYTSPHIHSWIFETLRVIIFWVRVTHKMLNVNWEKIHSIILSVTCHGLRNFPLLIHIPSKPFMNFWNPMSYYFLRVTRKMQPQIKGPGMLWGQSYVLPMTWGGVEAYGGPLSVDMQPYGCFIFYIEWEMAEVYSCHHFHNLCSV